MESDGKRMGTGRGQEHAGTKPRLPASALEGYNFVHCIPSPFLLPPPKKKINDQGAPPAQPGPKFFRRKRKHTSTRLHHSPPPLHRKVRLVVVPCSRVPAALPGIAACCMCPSLLRRNVPDPLDTLPPSRLPPHSPLPRDPPSPHPRAAVPLTRLNPAWMSWCTSGHRSRVVEPSCVGAAQQQHLLEPGSQRDFCGGCRL